MKKSEIYHLAQIAVVSSPCIAPENKLEIVRVLFADENIAKYGEAREVERLAKLREAMEAENEAGKE